MNLNRDLIWNFKVTNWQFIMELLGWIGRKIGKFIREFQAINFDK